MSASYKNPFSGINASTLGDRSILDYWCDPFRYELFSGIKEEDIYQDETNIVFMGGRATGKSMFLRFWSYQVQFLAAKEGEIKFFDKIKNNKGIGFYFRIDGSTLKSFQGYDLPTEHWSALFCHYFELVVGREYMEAIKLLVTEKSIEIEVINNDFLPKLNELLGCDGIKNLEQAINEFDKRIKYIDLFRGNVAFYKKSFEPDGKIFPPKSLSFGIAKLIISNIPSFQDINIILLLDEYENFLEYQQIFINSILKFTESNIKFRIGMRLEGFRTYKVIDTEDYIKEGREYRKFVFEDIINKNEGYDNFLADVARKRLEGVSELKNKGFTNIANILTQRENLEEEAKDLVKNDPNRIYNYFVKSMNISKEDLDLVRNKENPLIELMNFIWLSRGKSADETFNSMNDYLERKGTERGQKYANDYVKKYKLSLMLLLCSIYKKRKKYYSFNTFVFLSSGIIGNFIELCRTSFAVAGWGDNDKLLQEGKISKEDQATAAIEVSTIAKRQISRIEDYGGELSLFVENLGNIFREYHLDFKIRYPETNQFTSNIESIQNKELQNAMRAAIKWSVIMQKPKMQRSAPSENLGELYTLNRIFSPIFQISYRTRGGWSLSLNEAGISELITKKLTTYSEYLPRTSSTKKSTNNFTPSLFSDDE